MSKVEAIIEYLGYLAVLYLALIIALKTFDFVRKSFLSSPLDVKKLGEWALVTGSTDGIGKAYAFALAKKGMNIILVSRTPYKLQNVAAEIETKYKVQTKIIDIDFGSNAEAYKARLEKQLKDLDIGILVNNVGYNVEMPTYFLEMDSETIQKMVDVNLVSMNIMTGLILPRMEIKERGAIINIGSLASEVPNPMYSIYAATKAYVAKFSQTLALEYGSKGVTIQCITPGYVVSNMSKIRRSTWMAPTPEVFVASALSRLGIYSFTTGYLAHDIMLGAINILPKVIAERIVFNQLNVVRAKAKKAQKKKSKDQ